jgi:hypothetical protein
MIITDRHICHYPHILYVGGVVDEDAWKQLMSLAKHPQVNIKISALFRVSTKAYPHEDLDKRLLELVQVESFFCLLSIYGHVINFF